jgi:hypothetical protein
MARRKPKRVEWITLAEACTAWRISKTPIINLYWDTIILMRKSGGTWTVYVRDMIAHFGEPKIPIEVEPIPDPKSN